MADLTKTFVREIEVFNASLKIHQAAIGDVGCVVWDAAIVLAKYLEKTKRGTLGNKKVLELGSGTGVVGLCCCLIGYLFIYLFLILFIYLFRKRHSSVQILSLLSSPNY